MMSPPAPAAFQVSVLPSARLYSANADETLLAAGIRAGIALP